MVVQERASKQERTKSNDGEFELADSLSDTACRADAANRRAGRVIYTLHAWRHQNKQQHEELISMDGVESSANAV